MRHEKAEQVLRLAIELRASSIGLTLDEMQQRLQDNFGETFARRTVERLRDAVGRLFPQLEVVRANEYPKRWRLPGHMLGLNMQPTSEELTSLDLAVKLLRRQHLKDDAANLARLGGKARTALPAPTARKMEIDLQPLLEAEGVALRPGPRLAVAGERIAAIRQAIQLSKRIRISYQKRDGKEEGSYVVEPYGILYGNTRPYLIGYVPARRGIRHFSLSDITAIDLVPESFIPDPTFSLSQFSEQSFGVFQEKDGPYDVVWKFTPQAARDARQFIFHPGQTIDDQKDGSLIIRFTACGLREMVWHLATWHEHVEIISPQELKDAYCDFATSIGQQATRLRRRKAKA